MSQGATREGVQDTEDNGTPEFNDRNQDIEAIAAAAARARDDEMRKHGMEPVSTVEEEKPADKPEGDDEAKPEEASPEGEETDTNAPPDEEFITLKIDGQEQKVPKSKVFEAGQRALQKESSADRRLEEAARILREAQEAAAKLSAGAKPAGDTPTERGGSDDTAKPSFDARAIVEKLQYGNTDEAAAALEQLADTLGRPSSEVATQTQGMTPTQIAAYVSETIQFQSAMEKFQAPPEQGGFGDIWQDPFLRKLAIDKEAELRKEGDKRPYWDVYQDVGKSVREWVQKLTGPTQKPANLDDKRERKKTIVNVNGAGAAATSDKKPQAPQTREDIVADMRRARGQL